VNSAEIVREFAGLAAGPGPVGERAGALLARLQRVLHVDAGGIGLLPPGLDTHEWPARSGYDERVLGYLDGPVVIEDVGRAGLRGAGRPVRLSDLSIAPSELVGWAEYLEPAGFRDGMGVELCAPDGRYLGVLAVHTEAAARMTLADRALLALLVTPIAAGVDPWRSLATVAGMVEQATSAIVLSPSGSSLPLPGLPDHHPLLAPGSAVLAVAMAQLAEGGVQASFLAPVPADDAASGDGALSLVRITVLTAPPDVRGHAAAVVLAGPPGDLHGLSTQELQVLGLLVTGASNERIAVALGITRRTVDGHLDHVRAKLAGRTRTAAAARALRLGLFVPPALFVRRSARAPQGRPPN
jgi:DNA-binding CsgD family transcriptional regulator